MRIQCRPSTLGLGIALMGLQGAAMALPCGSTLLADHSLTADMVCAGTALYVGADNVKLDLAGFKIVSTVAQPAVASNGGAYDGVVIVGPGRIEAPQSSGIDATGLHGGLITNVSFVGNHTAIWARSPRGLRVAENYMSSAQGGPSAAYGVVLEDGALDVEIVGNTIQGMSQVAVRFLGIVDVAQRALVRNNYVSASVAGIVFHGGNENSIVENTLRGVPTAISVLTSVNQDIGASYNRVEGNRITGADFGISIHSYEAAPMEFNTVGWNLIAAGSSPSYAVLVGGSLSASTKVLYNTMYGYPQFSFMPDYGTATYFEGNACDGQAC